MSVTEKIPFFYLWFWCFDIFFLDFTSFDCYRMYFTSLFFFKSCFDIFDKSITLSCKFYGLVRIIQDYVGCYHTSAKLLFLITWYIKMNKQKLMFHYYCLIFINACAMRHTLSITWIAEMVLLQYWYQSVHSLPCIWRV
jgi:hypothetical protein